MATSSVTQCSPARCSPWRSRADSRNIRTRRVPVGGPFGLLVRFVRRPLEGTAMERHVWTITTRRLYESTDCLPVPTVMEHGVWIYSPHPISEHQARRAARSVIGKARITSATAGRHQITTRHQVGKHASYAHQYTDGYVQCVSTMEG
jgi:hypothetical protein